MKAARYHVVHETRYEYHQPVGLSRQVVRLAPRVIPWQLCRSHALRISPEAEILAVRADAFGNPVTSFAIEADHASLAVRAESWVDVSARVFPDDAATPPWEKVRARLAYRGGYRPLPADLDAARFLFESTRVRNKRELSAWTLASFPPGAPLLVGVRALMNRIHREFTFDPKATDVSTPVMEVFTRRRGVCQDFAPLMLSCLRSVGLAARDVSGYLLTRPPPGRPRLIGADASHAWVSAWVPGAGWVEVDPTNDKFIDDRYVILGWGRDYADVPPLRGVIFTEGSGSRLTVSVDLVPAGSAPLP